MGESEGQENMIRTSRSLASKNYFFFAGFFGAAFAIIPSFWHGVSIPFVIILFIVSYQENFKPPILSAPGDPPLTHRAP